MDDITLDRMTREQMFEEIEHCRYRKLLLDSIDRIAGVGYYEWCERENRLLFCSEEYARIFGLTPAQMLEAESSWEKTLLGVHPEDRERYRQDSENQGCPDSIELEYRIVRPDGEIRHVRETCVSELEPKTCRKQVFGILQDITELRQQREALEYREALAHEAESITAIGHFIYNENLATYKYVSPGFARIFGVSPEVYREKIKTAQDDLGDIYPDDVHRVQEIYDRYDEDGQPYAVEYRVFRADGEIRWVRERCVTYREEDGAIIESLGVLQDITPQKQAESELLATTLKLQKTVHQLETEIEERKRAEQQLKYLANHDALTGLPSRRLCMDRLQRSIAESRRSGQANYLLFIDLDGFKRINDDHGHDFGDQVLRAAAERIGSEIRETDTAARIGGDEFLVILTAISERQIVDRIAANLIANLGREIHNRDIEVSIGASIGIACYPDDAQDPENLIQCADKAMYRIKQRGKNDFAYFSELD